MSPSAAVTSVTVPRTALLDAPELEATLRCALRCELSALQSLDCGGEKKGSAADGFLSQCGSMTVEAVVRGRAHKLHLFIKRADAKDIVEGMDSFPREALFYQTVMPHLERAWRRCDNPEEPRRPDLGPAAFLGTDSLVVMEDLTRLGYKPAENWVMEGLGFSAIQQVLRALARLHAASLLAERLDGVDLAAAAPDLLTENFLTRQPGSVGRRLFDCAADVVCDVLLPLLQPRLEVPQTKQELQRLRDLTRDIFLELDAYKIRAQDTSGVLVLSHGDVWPNNALFKFDEQGRAEHAVMVDFQMARLAPPALDVAMFMHTGMSRSFRDEHGDVLVRGYYDDLARFTKERGLDISKDYGWEVFQASMEQLTPIARIIGIAYLPMNSGNTTDMAAIFADTEARTSILMDSETRGRAVTQWFAGEARYRRIVQACTEDLLGLPRAPAKE